MNQRWKSSIPVLRTTSYHAAISSRAGRPIQVQAPGASRGVAGLWWKDSRGEVDVSEAGSLMWLI